MWHLRFEIVQVHRFSYKETGGIERVANLQFSIFGFDNGKMSFAFIAEDTASIRQPCHLDFVAFLQVVNMNTFTFKSHTLNVCAIRKRSEIGLPIGKTEELRKQTERCSAGCICAIDVSPKAFERSGRDIFMKPFPDDSGKKLEVIRSTDLALHLMLNIHPQGCYFR